MTSHGRQFARAAIAAPSAPGAAPANSRLTGPTGAAGLRRRDFIGAGMFATAVCATGWPYLHTHAGEPDWSDGTGWDDGRGWSS